VFRDARKKREAAFDRLLDESLHRPVVEDMPTLF
jgi:hypothetical protein